MFSTYRHGRPTIGVLAGWQFYKTATNLSYLAPIYRGICKAARDSGCNLLLGCGIGPSASPTDPMKPAWPVPSPDQDFIPISEWNTDGLIIAVPLHSQERSAYVQNLIKSGHPILYIGSGETGQSIATDNSGGINEAMRHLLQHGHRKIVFIAGSENDIKGDTGERLQAYKDFCQKNHLSLDPCQIVYGQHVYSGGYLAVQKFMNSGVEFTALLASNDESALGAMDSLRAAGLRIPEDVAVIGFDNRLEGAVQEPGLTSIHVPLFDIGYRSVELLLDRIQGNSAQQDVVKVGTRLVIRESCGCGKAKNILTGPFHQISVPNSVSFEERISQITDVIAKTIMNQSHSLTEEDSQYFVKRLVNAYITSAQSGDRLLFLDTLLDVLQRTEESEDDVHLWQEAISLLETGLSNFVSTSTSPAKDILVEARQIISSQMQQQYRRYVMRERWTSSRLSLLTAELLTALEENQIYGILMKHLPEMDIHTAKLVLFEEEDDDPFAWSTVRDVLLADQQPLRFVSRDFPSADLFDDKKPFMLTLIPLLDQSGQLGYMAFGTEHLDLYGAIVQQLSSAFNTTRLYRQATVGRQLAEQANQMKNRFLSTISHELRTPLNLIVGLSGVLLQEDEEKISEIPASTIKDIQRIHAYAQHLGGLIGDVIDLATLDAGQFRLNKELIDFGETLQVVVESGSQLALDKGLVWRANIPKSGPWVWGDRTRLRQVVLNLVNNAIKFTDCGEINLSFSTDGNKVTISVQDTGLGIPPEEQEVIFDAFRRSERSIALGYPGLGLGLAICKMMIEMHDGTMGLRSSGVEGEGSEFYLTLPVEMPPQRNESRDGETFTQEQSVLLISHQIGTSDPLSSLLKQRGMKVQEVAMGTSLDWQLRLANDIPDVIVLDLTHNPNLSWKTLKAIKDNHLTKGIPTFLYTSAENGESLLSLDYLTKPVEPDDLTKALDQHWDSVDPTSPSSTILVVDDDPNTLDLHARIVRSQSASNRVLLASNGLEALKILQQEKIDLVLLDLQMPEMDGFDVLQAMRVNKRNTEIPVIVVTGKTLNEEDMKRLDQGVAVVLQKGVFSMDETVAHIESTLEKKRNLSTNTQYLVRQAMAYMHEHYFESISRKNIAQYVNISEDYLTFCFRQELKTTPIKYLQRYRINQAKSFLRNSQKSITEIALDVGFSDSGYFSRIFHRETGMSPENFRRS